MTKRLDVEARIELFRNALGFEGINNKQLAKISRQACQKSYTKGSIIFHQAEPCSYFHIVAKGIVKVAFCSSGGTTITYLLAEKGEPLNLVGPFTGLPRMMSAKALEDTELLLVERDWIVEFVLKREFFIEGFQGGDNRRGGGGVAA